MSDDMRYKVLLAIDNQMAENAFKTRIAKMESEYEVVGQVVHKDSVLDFISENSVDVLVIMEGLNGSTDDFKFVIDLKLKYPTLRIVFIAGDRKPGDKNLAKLVSYQIFDILAGNRISIVDMVNRTINPATWKDASIYLPNNGRDTDIFSDEELSGINGTTSTAGVVNTTTTEVLSDENEYQEIAGASLKDKFNKKKNAMKLRDDSPIASTPTPTESAPVVPVAPPPVSTGGANAKEMDALRKQLQAAEKRAQQAEAQNQKLENEKNKVLNKNRELAGEYDKLLKEYSDMDKSRNVSSKQKIITFFGAVPGVGCTTAALNTAVYLSLCGHKTIYIELNDISPSLTYWFDLGDIENGLERAFFGLETRNHQEVDDCIVTKETILRLKSDMADKHENYPENLHYLFFSDAYIKAGEISKVNPNTLKDLLLYLLYKTGYDYIILDVYAHSEFHLLETATIFSSLNVFVMTQDVFTVGTSLKMFAALKSNGVEFEFLKDPTVKGLSNVNYKNIYLINKYNKNIKLNRPKIKDWLEAERITVIPENYTDIANALFYALPAVLMSKNKEYLVSIKQLTEMFK